MVYLSQPYFVKYNMCREMFSDKEEELGQFNLIAL